MWVFTTGGFVSAVEHRDNKDLVMVRARDRKSLDTMIEGIELAGNAINADGEKLSIEQDLEPKASDTADYRWRVTVSKATFALWLQFEVLNYLNYPNFKSALGKFRGSDFTRAAHRVWDDMQLVSDGTQVYGGVGVGGKTLKSKYSYGGGGYGGNYSGTYGGGGWGSETSYPAKKWNGSKYPAAGETGSTFFEGDPEWEEGLHGFRDGVEDQDIIDSYKLDGEEDIPELPEGAENWSDEEFEAWLDDQASAKKPEEGTPMALEPVTEEEQLTYDQAKAELKALTTGKEKEQAKPKSKYQAKKEAAAKK